MTSGADGQQSSWFQRFLLPGFAFKAVVIGGGYATGRELAEFFLPSGPWGGLAGMVLAMLAWSLICAVTFAFAHAARAYDYRTFFEHLLGPAWIVFAATTAWYLTRGNLALGIAVSACVGALLLAAHQVAHGSTASWLAWGVGSFVVGWVIQFVGHWYEGRTPAFVDDLVGLLVGPMFVTAEAMFMLGWNKPLLAEIERRAGPTVLRDMAKIA